MTSVLAFSPRLSLAVAAAAILAACAPGNVTVTRTDYAHQYTPLEVGAAAGGDRQMKVSVVGNPFDMPNERLAQAVLRSMQGRTSGIPVNFASEPENPDPSRNYHVVVAFNPQGPLDPAQLCAAGSETPVRAPVGGRITMMGAFCLSDSFLSHAIARADAPNGTDSEAFDALVAQLTFALFPPVNPNQSNESTSIFPGS